MIPRLIEETHARLQEGGAGFAGPPVCVCPFPGEDGTAELAVGWPLDTAGRGPGRVYWSDPEQVADPNDYVTVIEWPIRAGGKWPPDADYFERRAG